MWQSKKFFKKGETKVVTWLCISTCTWNFDVPRLYQCTSSLNVSCAILNKMDFAICTFNVQRHLGSSKGGERKYIAFHIIHWDFSILSVCLSVFGTSCLFPRILVLYVRMKWLHNSPHFTCKLRFKITLTSSTDTYKGVANYGKSSWKILLCAESNNYPRLV